MQMLMLTFTVSCTRFLCRIIQFTLLHNYVYVCKYKTKQFLKEYTGSFAEVSPVAWRLAMATADSLGPGWQIESNIPAARRPTIE